jgi:hypothetical protein
MRSNFARITSMRHVGSTAWALMGAQKRNDMTPFHPKDRVLVDPIPTSSFGEQ